MGTSRDAPPHPETEPILTGAPASPAGGGSGPLPPVTAGSRGAARGGAAAVGFLGGGRKVGSTQHTDTAACQHLLPRQHPPTQHPPSPPSTQSPASILPLSTLSASQHPLFFAPPHLTPSTLPLSTPFLPVPHYLPSTLSASQHTIFPQHPLPSHPSPTTSPAQCPPPFSQCPPHPQSDSSPIPCPAQDPSHPPNPQHHFPPHPTPPHPSWGRCLAGGGRVVSPGRSARCCR